MELLELTELLKDPIFPSSLTDCAWTDLWIFWMQLLSSDTELVTNFNLCYDCVQNALIYMNDVECPDYSEQFHSFGVETDKSFKDSF